MTNIEIAKLLRKVAAVYTIQNDLPAGRQGNRFKIIAYENAATTVEHSSSEIKDLWDDGKLDDLPGIGKSLLAHFHELFTTGKVQVWDNLFKKYPDKMFTLLDVPGIGPKTAYKICTQKGFVIPEKLERAIKCHEKTVKKDARVRIDQAEAIAGQIVEYLGEGEVLGSLRRRVATIGDIDIAVKSDLVGKFIKYPHSTVIKRGPAGASISLSSGQQVDLRVAKPNQWGSMLQYFTGSKYHNIKIRELAIRKKMKINEYGISGKNFDDEKAFYNYLGLDYIEPELREDQGEIEAAQSRSLPDLVTLKDIQGDLQTHSSYDDEPSHDLGKNTMAEMLAMAKKLGYRYLAFSEHNPRKNADVFSILKRRYNFIEQLKKSTKDIRILNLLEVDIDSSGELNLPPESEKFLDGILVSIHSSFDLGREPMTKRVLKGLSHPLARIFAHPTGRLLGKREGYELDWNQIFDFCKTYNRAIEINATPNRLDLPDVLVREAVRRNVLLSLGTDAHNIDGMKNMRYGVDVARRGWATKSDIINCWNYDKLVKWIRR